MVTFANSVDPDEMAHNEPSHLDLHCLPFCFGTPVCNSEHAQIQSKRPFQKLEGERVKLPSLRKLTFHFSFFFFFFFFFFL